MHLLQLYGVDFKFFLPNYGVQMKKCTFPPTVDLILKLIILEHFKMLKNGNILNYIDMSRKINDTYFKPTQTIRII